MTVLAVQARSERPLARLRRWLSSPVLLWASVLGNAVIAAFWAKVVLTDGWKWKIAGAVLSVVSAMDARRGIRQIRQDREARRDRIVRDVMES